MIGAILGDIVGSLYEFDNIKTKAFELFDIDCFFTDDELLYTVERFEGKFTV